MMVDRFRNVTLEAALCRAYGDDLISQRRYDYILGIAGNVYDGRKGNGENDAAALSINVPLISVNRLTSYQTRRNANPGRKMLRGFVRGLTVDGDYMHFNGLTIFGLVAVTLMLIFYAFERRSPWYVLAF